MTDHLKLYNELLCRGKQNVCSRQQCGEYEKQLKDLHDFIYIVESTPNPIDPYYTPMSLECIIHKDLWTPMLYDKLVEHNFSFRVLDYNKDKCDFHVLPDTERRRLLFEMLGKWWFFNNTPSPTYALSEAIKLRNHFFKQEFAYLPEKFRKLVEEKGFCGAIDALSDKENMFLDRFIEEMNEPSFLCFGCIPAKKSAFLQRLKRQDHNEVPELEIYESDGLDVKETEKAVLSGDLLYMVVDNYYDCADRNLYTNLYNIFKEETKNI